MATSSRAAGDQLPVHYQQPSYVLRDSGDAASPDPGEMTIPVGADISSSKPVTLQEIMRRLARLKQMTVSWASDVDKRALVDVDIQGRVTIFLRPSPISWCSSIISTRCAATPSLSSTGRPSVFMSPSRL
ncbi:MAG: hypothetical protein U5J62_00190 [Desulfurivibrio sp.]|nr:hypothetical protein [Desulfurivibrio sp.]